GLVMQDGTLQKILTAANLDEIPAEGLIIGLVRDETNRPAAGVTVAPKPAMGSVSYLGANLESVGGTMTTTSGYFISTDIPYNSTWVASDASGRQQAGSYRTGLI